jgi:DUF438 domain-containing protein
MKLTANTSLDELLEAYPFLLEFLVGYNPKFGLLKNKLMRATVGKMATMKQVAALGEVSLRTLLRDIAAEIENHTGEDMEFEAGPEPGRTSDGEKLTELKEIIRDLHRDVPMEEVKKRFDELISDVEPTEIAAMEQQLISEGMPVEEIQRLSDVHVSLFKDALDVKDLVDAPPGHPLHTFAEENREFRKILGDLDLLLQQLQMDDTMEKLNELEGPLQKEMEALSKVEIHYQRKENQLFPFLEDHGIGGPPQVMWGRHDEIRALIKQAMQALESRDPGAFLEKGKECAQAVEDMIYKEEHILFPLSLETLDESDWIDIRKGESEIGYAFSPPAVNWPISVIHTEDPRDAGRDEEATGQLELDTGRLTPDQVNLMLKHLPLDMTFVDEDDRVRYYSAGKERIFPRSPGIIGRSVQKCHPPKSLDVVNRIVGEFKAGTRDEAAFWIEVEGGRLIHIRYFAVRDEDGAFRGTLEVSQDITEIKSIEGERRLLDWDAE